MQMGGQPAALTTADYIRNLSLIPAELDPGSIEARADVERDTPGLKGEYQYKNDAPLCMPLFCREKGIRPILDVFRESEMPDLSLRSAQDLPYLFVNNKQKATIFVKPQ